MVEIQKKFKVTLSNDEICEAISQYIEDNSCGELILGDCLFILKTLRGGDCSLKHSPEIKVEVEAK